jgi:anti-sigma-K factor RskA
MTPDDEELERFEKRARALLEESVARIDARTRSRLNQARHAALDAAARRRRTPRWRSFGLAPAAGVVAALALAVGAASWADVAGRRGPIERGGRSGSGRRRRDI